MHTYTLPFGDITILQENLAEVVIYDGIIMDEGIVDDYHNFLLLKLKSPFSLLINKKFAYSYTFDAQLKIGSLSQIDKMAVIVYSNFTEMATKSLISLNVNKNWNIKIFQDRDLALTWLLTTEIKKEAI
jgi:hypothetical protein